MKNIYCGHSEFLRAVKRNSKSHLLSVILDQANKRFWFFSQVAVWSFTYSDNLQMQRMKMCLSTVSNLTINDKNVKL